MASLQELLGDDDAFRRHLLGLPEAEAGPQFPPPVPFADPAPTPAATPEPEPEPVAEPQAAGEDVSVAPDVVDDVRAPLPDESALEPAPAPAAPTPAKADDASGFKGLLDYYENKKAAMKPELGTPHSLDKVSQALYAAGTRSKLPDTFFGQASSKDGMNPLEMAKLMQGERRLDLDDKIKNATLDEKLLQNKFMRGITERKTDVAEHGDTRAGDKLAFDQDMAKQKVKISGQRMALDLARAQDVDRRFAGTQLDNFTKDTKHLQPIVAALNEVDKIAPGLAHGALDPAAMKALSLTTKLEDLPVLRGFGSRLMPNDVVKLKSAVTMVNDMFQHELFGAALTPQEIGQFRAMANNALGSSPESQAAFLDLLRRKVGGELRTKEAAYRQSVPGQMWQQYTQGGGFSTDMPLFSDLFGGQTGAAPSDDPYAEMKSMIAGNKTGQEALGGAPAVAPPPPAEKMVDMIAPDGSHRQVPESKVQAALAAGGKLAQ